MTELCITFDDYKKPDPERFWHKFSFPVSSHLNLSWYKVKRSIETKLDVSEVFLAKKTTFKVDGSLVGRQEPVELEIVKWTYELKEDSEFVVNLSAREVKPRLSEFVFSKLPDEMKVILWVVLLFAFSGAGIFLYYAITSFPEPSGFWSFVGRNIRTTVAWSLFVIGIVAVFWSQSKSVASSIFQSFLGFFFGLLVWLLPILWLAVSRPPQEIVGNPNESILYLSYLRHHAGLFTLAFVGIIPWLTIFLKYFGWDLLSSVLGKISKDNEK